MILYSITTEPSKLPWCPHLHPCRLWHILLDHSHPGYSLVTRAPVAPCHPSGRGIQRHLSAALEFLRGLVWNPMGHLCENVIILAG